MSEVKIVINATGGAQAQGEAQKAAAGFKDLAAQARAAGVSAGQTTAAFRQLPAQLTDVFTSLAGGQNPLLVLLQQGGQVSDSFGGMRNAAQALATVFTPLRVVVGAVAGTLGLAALAANQAQREQGALKNAIASTGNAAGTSADQLNRYARDVSGVSGTVGSAVQALAALVATGRVANAELTDAAAVAVRAEKLRGTAVADTVQAYAALGRDPVGASLKLNESTNFLTASLLRQITALTARGNVAAAASLAQQALSNAENKALNETEANLTSLEKAWLRTKEVAADWWNQVVGIGRPEDLAAQLKKTEDALENSRLPSILQRLFAKIDIRSEELKKRNAGGIGLDGKTGDQRASDEQGLVDQKENIREQQRVVARAADLARARVERERAAVEAQQPARQQAAAQLSLQTTIAAAEAIKRAKQTELRDLQDLYDAGNAALEDFIGKKARLQREELEADLQIVLARQRAERAAAPQDKVGADAQAARLVALRSQERAVREAIARNTGDPARGLPSQAGREFELAKAKEDNAGRDATRKAYAQELEVASQALDDLVQANREANLAQIKDDRLRGEAQIALFRQQSEARIAALAGDPVKYAAAQEAVNEAVALKTKELNQRLRPEWQRLLEDWSDTTKLMASAVDNSITGSMKSAEDAFVSLATTGKLNIKSLVNSIIADFARVQARQGIAALLKLGLSYFNTNIPAGNGVTPGVDGGNFARGGAFTNALVSTPTVFRFAQGGALRNGLMGEAGPEAIMPLTRDSAGRLGVRAQGGSGGGAAPINIVVNGDATPGTVRMIEEALAKYDRQRRRMGRDS
jgi:lambda family phage tail tape measure protein